MVTYADNVLTWVVHFLLIATRMTSVFVLSPILGRNNIPSMAKIGLSVLTAFILINLYPPAQSYPFDNLPSLLLAIVLELMVGLVIGFGVLAFFHIMHIAGQIIDVQIGFSMSQQFDPSSGGQVSVSGTLLNLVFIECFLVADGIPTLIHIMGRTFEVIPVGKGVAAPELAWVALESFSLCFTLAINIAMPLLASALLCEIALGIIVRTAPQMNVFVIGIPIKVIVGLVMLAMSVPIFVSVTNSLFDHMYDTVNDLLTLMVPG